MQAAGKSGNTVESNNIHFTNMEDKHQGLLSRILIILIYFLLNGEVAESGMVLPKNNCFRTLRVRPVAARTTAPPSSADSSDEGSTSCVAGTLLCPEELLREGGRDAQSIRRPRAPNEVVYFIADDVNSCIYWRCLTSITAVRMRCAPGSKVPDNYVGGSGNPCTVRYFESASKACTKKSSTTESVTTRATPILPTLSGGIVVPTEIPGPVTRPPFTTNSVGNAADAADTSSEPITERSRLTLLLPRRNRGRSPLSLISPPTTTVQPTTKPPEVLDLRVASVPTISPSAGQPRSSAGQPRSGLANILPTPPNNNQASRTNNNRGSSTIA